MLTIRSAFRSRPPPHGPRAAARRVPAPERWSRRSVRLWPAAPRLPHLPLRLPPGTCAGSPRHPDVYVALTSSLFARRFVADAGSIELVTHYYRHDGAPESLPSGCITTSMHAEPFPCRGSLKRESVLLHPTIA